MSSSSSSSSTSSVSVSFCGAEDLSAYFHISKKVQKLLPVSANLHSPVSSTLSNFAPSASSIATSSSSSSSSSSTSSSSSSFLPLSGTFAGDVDYLPGPSVFSFPRIRLAELNEAKMKINCEKDTTIQRILELQKTNPPNIRTEELPWIYRIEQWQQPASSAAFGVFRFRSDSSDLSATLSNLLPKFEMEYNGIQVMRDRLRNNDQAKAVKRRRMDKKP